MYTLYSGYSIGSQVPIPGFLAPLKGGLNSGPGPSITNQPWLIRRSGREENEEAKKSPAPTITLGHWDLNSLLGRFWKPCRNSERSGWSNPGSSRIIIFWWVLNFFLSKFTVLALGYFSHFACQKPGHKKWCNITTRQKLVVLWFNAFPHSFPGYFQGEPAVWGSRFALASNRLWPTVHAAAGVPLIKWNWWLENRSFVKSEWIVSIIFRIRLMEW